MTEEILKIGGNTFKEKIGKSVEGFGKSIVEKGKAIIESAKPTIVSNPTCKVVNPFTIIISFKVAPSDKYQIVIEGDYKQYYKESGEGTLDMSNEQLFHIIKTNKSRWFKKE